MITANILLGQKVLVANADRYNLSLKSQFPHRLKVEVKSGRKSKSYIIPPQQTISLDGYYSTSKLKRSKAICKYDEEVYQMDRRELEHQLRDLKTALETSRKQNENKIFANYRNKVFAELASKFRTGSKNKFIQGLEKAVNKGGKIVKAYYGVTEVIERINSRGYTNYNELFADYLIDYYKNKYINKAKRLIEREYGLDADMVEYITEATVYYLEKGNELDANFREAEDKIDIEFSDKFKQIKKIRNDRSFRLRNTSTIYKLITKPIDLRTKSPRYFITFDPVNYGLDLNTNLVSPHDRVLKYKDDIPIIYDGLWNSTLGGSILISIMREFRVSKRAYTRLYGGVSYYNTAYTLENKYFLSRSLFKTIPPSAEGFEISQPIVYNHSRLAGVLNWRFFIGESWIIDLEGGYTRQRGLLDLRKSKLTEGFSWQESTVRIVEDSYHPFYGVRVGYGFNSFNRGLHFTAGLQLFKMQHINSTEHTVFDSTKKPLNFDTNGSYNPRIHLGISLSL